MPQSLWNMLQLQKIAMLANAGTIMESLSIAIIIQREKSWLKWPNRSLWSSQGDLIHVVELDGRHSLITGTWIRCCRTIDLTLVCFFRAIWVNYPGYSWENGYFIYEKWREGLWLAKEMREIISCLFLMSIIAREGVWLVDSTA